MSNDNSQLKITVTVDGAFINGIQHNIVSHETHEEYNISSGENGETVILLPIGVYTVTSTYTRDGIVYDNQINTIVIKSPYQSYINTLLVELKTCKDNILLEKGCKYFHHDPYMTPNNYDLYFDYANIPSNIITESPAELHKRLQNCLPLDKILHLNLDTHNEKQENTINIQSNVYIKYNSRVVNSDESNLFNPRIYVVWNDALINEYITSMQEYEIRHLIPYYAELLGLTYNINTDTVNNIMDNREYNGTSVLTDLLTVFFNNSLNINNLSSTDIIRIGREHTTNTGMSDVELSTHGRDYITSLREEYITSITGVFNKTSNEYHQEILVDLYLNNIRVFKDLSLNSDNDYNSTLENCRGVSYTDGVFNVTDSEDILIDGVNGVNYETGTGVLTVNDSLEFTYTDGVFTIPDTFDTVKLHIYKTRNDNSILDYELNNYNITYTLYHFYTCKNCGNIIYSNEDINTCSECNHNEFTISDVPYTVTFNDYADTYYSKEKIKLL